MKKIKVLIVDDSAVVRRLLEKYLSEDRQIEVVGKASNPFSARDKIVFLKPDVLTLDIDMPRMNGLEFLEKLMPQYPMPVIMVSSMTDEGSEMTLKALDLGAFDYVLKPSGINSTDVMISELIAKIKTASTVDVSRWGKPAPDSSPFKPAIKVSEHFRNRIIAIGASTGGTVAIRKLISSFSADMPPIVITQHMPPVFTQHFADSLNLINELNIKEAQDGDDLLAGRVLIAPGDLHMEIVPHGNQFKVRCFKDHPVNGHCPSVDVLFHSVARHAGSRGVGLLLTGMGRDGAEGLLHIRNSSGRTIAQDEASSVVFGMPRAGYENGGAEMLVPLNNIDHVMADMLNVR